MSGFWKIKKLDYYSTALELKKYIPELKESYIDHIVDHLRGSGLSIIKEQQVKQSIWIRLTLPFAIVFLFLLLITSPLKFIITGRWSYRVLWISNWFRSVGF